MNAIVIPRKTSSESSRDPVLSGIISLMFSDIVQRFETSLNALYQERDHRKSQGLPVIDLVSGNVNKAGFNFPLPILKQSLSLGAERARQYSTVPLGQLGDRDTM